MERFSIAISWLFGLILLGLSVFVALETVSRKLFAYSFQGADELGGYVLAVGGALAFSVALVERGHVRIDFVHEHLPARAQAGLNVLAALTMALLGGFFVRYCYPVVRDTVTYGSTAATPWATPLIYPQALWYGALVVFGALAILRLIQALWILLRGDAAALNRLAGPKSAQEELDEEVSNLRQR